MKNLLGIVAAIAALPACIIESSEDPFCGDGFVDAGEACDDGNNVNGDGCSSVCTTEIPSDLATITANWTIQTTAGQTVGCPTGFDTAAIYNQPVDANFNPVGQPIIDLYDCVDGTGTATDLTPGVYQTWVAITNTNNTSTYAQSLSAFVDVTTSDKTITTNIVSDGGYFMLTWNLVDAGSNAALTCAQAQSQGVSVLSTEVANQSNFFDDIFDCADQFGITASLLAGTYTVSVSALGAGDASIGTAPALTNRTIQDRNRVTDLGNVTIPIN